MASKTEKSQAQESSQSLATRCVHADHGIAVHGAVAPAMHVSTTFRYTDNADELNPMNTSDPLAPRDSHVYSRESAPNTTRLEAVLGSVLGAPCVTYASGLAAFHAMLVRINPRRIAIGQGYHGCHSVIEVLSRLTGLAKVPLDAELQAGDVVHVETPLNPTGEARDLQHYADKARRAGAYLTVDATFAPPPLQDPFALGADVVLHSGTKYLGGHSDMLCGVLAVRPGLDGLGVGDLVRERAALGAVMGSFEGWLGLRSLRTLDLRVTRQSATATALVDWLVRQLGPENSSSSSTSSTGSSTGATNNNDGSGSSSGRGAIAALVERVQHASLQPEAADATSWLRRQMPRGYGPVFAIWTNDADTARRLPARLRLFDHATSLGGVESLIEWRAMSDSSVDRRLLRVSVGVESFEDLRDDLQQAFASLL